jgi:site-specific DNA recombinase
VNAAIYVRVSTAGQEADGTSLDTQEAACRAYAVEHGYTVAERNIYRETHTGAELWERPRLSALREAVRAEALDAVIVYALDRLSRKQAHVAIIADECERAGSVLLFVTEEFEQSAVGEFIRGAKAFAAELEREKIRERTQRGLLARAKGGKLRPGARPLYGYRWADESKGAYIVDPEKSAIVRRIFNESMNGWSLRRIASDLQEKGIVSPTGRARWSQETVRTILNHPGYTGKAVANTTQSTKRRGKSTWKTIPRPESDHIPLPEGTIPALIPPAVWGAVQDRLKRNQAESRRNSKHPEHFLLRGGIVRCGYCGRAVATKYTDKQEVYYQANQKGRTDEACPSLAMDAKTLDRIVWGHIEQDVLLNDDTIAREVAKVRQVDPTRGEVERIDQMLAEIAAKQKNLSSAIAVLDDPDASAPLLVQLKQLSERKKDLQEEREARQMRRETWEVRQAQLETIAAWRQQVAANLEHLGYQDRRDILAALQVTVKLYRKDAPRRYEVFAAIDPDSEPFLIGAAGARDAIVSKTSTQCLPGSGIRSGSSSPIHCWTSSRPRRSRSSWRTSWGTRSTATSGS